MTPCPLFFAISFFYFILSRAHISISEWIAQSGLSAPALTLTRRNKIIKKCFLPRALKKRIGQGKTGVDINLRQHRDQKALVCTAGHLFVCRKAKRSGHGEHWVADVRKTKLHVSGISAYKAVLIKQRPHVTEKHS